MKSKKLLLGLLAILLLASCTSTKQPIKKPTIKPTKPIVISTDYKNNPKLIAFIDNMVATNGFDRAYLNEIFAKVSRDESALQLCGALKKPAEPNAISTPIKKIASRPSWESYKANHADETRVARGVKFWHENEKYLQKAYEVYGVNPEYIVGIIGVETNFGGYTGKYSLLNALTSIGLEHPTRSKFFMAELEAYLLMSRELNIDPTTLKGSYAGAFGYAQFMPSSFRAYGVDFDGDGKKNLFTTADAIGSIANYFKIHKWRKDAPTAIKTNYASGIFSQLPTGYDTKYTQEYLGSIRITPVGGFSGHTGDVSLINLNTANGDELWLGTPNFYTITRYNHSNYYAMSVHHLASEVKKRVKP